MHQQNLPTFITRVPWTEEASEFEAVLTHLAELRTTVIDAWLERAVMFTPSQQEKLAKEMESTASLLHGLAHNA